MLVVTTYNIAPSSESCIRTSSDGAGASNGTPLGDDAALGRCREDGLHHVAAAA